MMVIFSKRKPTNIRIKFSWKVDKYAKYNPCFNMRFICIINFFVLFFLCKHNSDGQLNVSWSTTNEIDDDDGRMKMSMNLT